MQGYRLFPRTRPHGEGTSSGPYPQEPQDGIPRGIQAQEGPETNQPEGMAKQMPHHKPQSQQTTTTTTRTTTITIFTTLKTSVLTIKMVMVVVVAKTSKPKGPRNQPTKRHGKANAPPQTQKPANHHHNNNYYYFNIENMNVHNTCGDDGGGGGKNIQTQGGPETNQPKSMAKQMPHHKPLPL